MNRFLCILKNATIIIPVVEGIIKEIRRTRKGFKLCKLAKERLGTGENNDKKA